MPAPIDIFISYSSRDREKAEQLTELLSSAGLSVWIDKQGIDVATSWSAEIVDAIDSCKAMIVMLSPSSNESKNVAKEVALAAERNKKILPLDLEPVQLSRDLAYHLAGLQRAPMTNIDAIIRAIGKLGLEATQAPTMKLVKETDARKSLMILPFEDLSPTGDNGWFADGLASELVNALSHVKTLKLIDWNTSRGLKEKRIPTTTLAKEFNVRYFIEGQIRKFGDQIKISVTLLDIETGDHLWQDSLKGTMGDIFDIQENVAEKVVEGLKLHLTREEQASVGKRSTENAEAYELWLRGISYNDRNTRSDYERALALYQEAVRIDPRYATAYANLANVHMHLYQIYDRDTMHLVAASIAAEKVREIEGETAQYYWVKSLISRYRGDLAKAMHYAQQGIEVDPTSLLCYDAVSFVYRSLGLRTEEVITREKIAALSNTNINFTFALLICLHEYGDKGRLQAAAKRSVPLYERHTRLNPDDFFSLVNLASVYVWAGEESKALQILEKLSVIESLDSLTLYNMACTYLDLGDRKQGLRFLQNAVKQGYSIIEDFKNDPVLAPLRGTPEFEALMKEMEARVAPKIHG